MLSSTPLLSLLKSGVRMGTLDNKSVTSPAPKITEEERRKRQAEVDFAVANVGLEGFKPTPESLGEFARYVAGEMTSDELVSCSLARLKNT